MVDKDGRNLVPFPKEETLVLTDETRHRGLQLVNGNAPTRFGDCANVACLALRSPGASCCATVEA
jgi:hypothetical protein